MKSLRMAMTAPAELREFKGNEKPVQTAPFWDHKLAALELKLSEVHRMRIALAKKSQDATDAKDKTTKEQRDKLVEKYKKELLTTEEEALLQRAMGTGGGVHYHGSAKFQAQAGKAFAEALIDSGKK